MRPASLALPSVASPLQKAPGLAPNCHRVRAKATWVPHRSSLTLAGLGTALGVARALRAQGQPRRQSSVPMFLGPVPKWDTSGKPAVEPLAPGVASPKLERGKLHKVVWMCWTGHNPVPPHLKLCMRTVERNAGVPVILLTPQNIAEYVPDPHPAYPYLHLAHRADYLRCYLLHNYGGIYLDMDTICLQDLNGLFNLLQDYEAVGYDGSQWGELIGISDMGPFRPLSNVTELWFNCLHGKMERRKTDMLSQGTDVFYWQEILRDIVVPVTVMHRDKVSKALLAHNPEQETLWSTGDYQYLMGLELQRCHILILNNAKYGDTLGRMSEEEILAGPTVLSQLLRHALGMPT